MDSRRTCIDKVGMRITMSNFEWSHYVYVFSSAKLHVIRYLHVHEGIQKRDKLLTTHSNTARRQSHIHVATLSYLRVEK